MASIDHSAGRDVFGEDPAGYDTARPPYPAEMFAWIDETCGLGAQTRAFEIGPGTGRATAPLMSLGLRSLLAIEPDARLAAELGETFAHEVDAGRVRIDAVRFEDCELELSGFDFGVAATSLHWLARGRALAKVRAALRPGGWFAAVWQVFEDPERPDPMDRALAHILDGLEEAPRKVGRPKAFALDVASRLGELRAAGFVGGAHRLWREQHVFDAAALAALYGSFSRVQRAPDKVRERLLAEVGRLAELAGGDVTRDVQAIAYLARNPGPVS